MMLPKPLPAMLLSKHRVYVMGFTPTLQWALVVYRDYKKDESPGPGETQVVLTSELMFMMDSIEAVAE